MSVQTAQRWQFAQFLTRDPVDRSRRDAGGGGIHDHHPLGSAHLETDIHPGGATVDQLRTLGHATIPEMADQNRAHTVVTAQQVAAAND